MHFATIPRMRFVLTVFVFALAVTVARPAPFPEPVTKGVATPYDRYMEPVRSVLSGLGQRQVSLERVRALMLQGWSFRYVYTDPYLPKPPAVTSAERAGDCKDKSLWLAQKIGDQNIRYVIGKARSDSALSHAWLYWKDGRGRWWILDCANRKEPIRADRTGENEYIPYYSYTHSETYRHAAASGTRSGPVAANR